MLASARVIVARLLSLLVLAAALVAVHGTFGGGPTITDLVDLSSGGNVDSDDGADVPMFVPRVAAVPKPRATRRHDLQAHRAPATAPVVSRIFRPPISLLA